MRRTLLGIATLLVVLGCDNPAGGSPPADGSTSSVNVLPSLGGTTAARVASPAEETRANAIYYQIAPMIHSFTDNSIGVDIGDSFTLTNDIWGEITFAISGTADEVVYTGTEATGTVKIVITYNQVNDTFSFEQYAFFDDIASDVLCNGDPGNGTGSDTDGIDQNEPHPGHGIAFLIHARAENIPINSDGGFIGDLQFLVIFTDSQGSNLAGLQGAFGSLSAELYHGPMTSSSVLGTGVAFTDGYSYLIADTPLPNDANKPEGLSDLADITEMENYLASIGLATLEQSSISSPSTVLYREMTASAALSDAVMGPVATATTSLTDWAAVSDLF